MLVAQNVATPWNGSVPVCLNLNSTTTKVCRRTTVGIMQATDEADLKRSSKSGHKIAAHES